MKNERQKYAVGEAVMVNEIPTTVTGYRPADEHYLLENGQWVSEDDIEGEKHN